MFWSERFQFYLVNLPKKFCLIVVHNQVRVWLWKKLVEGIKCNGTLGTFKSLHVFNPLVLKKPTHGD